MSERKPWLKEEDILLKRLVAENEDKTEEKLKWGDIADLLNQNGNQRTGKQCRERWHNQLKPGIDNERGWGLEQEQILFRVQQKVGNRWAQIAKELPGRTDNNIKNYFYSTLRKAIRKVNAYVQMHKKQTHYRNVKEFKQQTLSKILSVAQKKYENKINLRNTDVESDAQKIKRLLVDIQRDDSIVPSARRDYKLEEIVEHILEFNRNCKRRKGKKKDEDYDESQKQPYVEQLIKIDEKQIKKSKKSKKAIDQDEEKDKVLPPLQKKNSSYMESSRNLGLSKNLSGSRNLSASRNLSGYSQLKKKSSSSGQMKEESSLLYGSSSFRQYQGGSGSNSQNYNPLFESRYFTGGGGETNFLSRIPNFERRQTNRSNPTFDFWQQQANPTPPPYTVEWSHNFMNRDDNNPLRMSLTLQTSCLLTRRASSRLEKKQSEHK